MTVYDLIIPIAGYAIVSVEAESKEEAKQKFLDGDVEVTIEDIEEWEAHEHLVQGNVFYGMQNEIEVEENKYASKE